MVKFVATPILYKIDALYDTLTVKWPYKQPFFLQNFKEYRCETIWYDITWIINEKLTFVHEWNGKVKWLKYTISKCSSITKILSRQPPSFWCHFVWKRVKLTCRKLFYCENCNLHDFFGSNEKGWICLKYVISQGPWRHYGYVYVKKKFRHRQWNMKHLCFETWKQLEKMFLVLFQILPSVYI